MHFLYIPIKFQFVFIIHLHTSFSFYLLTCNYVHEDGPHFATLLHVLTSAPHAHRVPQTNRFSSWRHVILSCLIYLLLSCLCVFPGNLFYMLCWYYVHYSYCHSLFYSFLWNCGMFYVWNAHRLIDFRREDTSSCLVSFIYYWAVCVSFQTPDPRSEHTFPFHYQMVT